MEDFQWRIQADALVEPARPGDESKAGPNFPRAW